MSTEPTAPRPSSAADQNLQLSIVIPAYNEESRLPATLEQVLAYLDRQELTFEVLAVDDGSSDRTTELVKLITARDARLRLLREPHRGKGAAVRAGALAASGRAVVFCDADLSNPVEELLRLPRQLETAEVVIGSREGEGARRVGEPGYRHLMGRVFNWFVRTLAVGGIQDTQCGLKCFRGSIARELFSRQTIDGFGFDVEILFLARKRGYRIQEVPITWRHVPRSRVDPVKDTLRMLSDVVRVRINDLLGRYD
jgi:glycosyltransferase involved in cell wall biosynthesis